jgi:hypothetical protein
MRRRRDNKSGMRSMDMVMVEHAVAAAEVVVTIQVNRAQDDPVPGRREVVRRLLTEVKRTYGTATDEVAAPEVTAAAVAAKVSQDTVAANAEAA